MNGADPEGFKRRLTAAEGFLELGLPQEAWNELDEIKPEHRDDFGAFEASPPNPDRNAAMGSGSDSRRFDYC
jgi:hypothetical protein